MAEGDSTRDQECGNAYSVDWLIAACPFLARQAWRIASVEQPTREPQYSTRANLYAALCLRACRLAGLSEAATLAAGEFILGVYQQKVIAQVLEASP